MPSPLQVAQRFMTPRRPVPPQVLNLPGGQLELLNTREGEVAVQQAGTGPAVLLLHGWEGQASDLAAFVPGLLSAGLSVVAMHLPAHGASSGQQTSIPQAARALREVGAALGPLHGAIAHSVGCAVLVEALHAGLAVGRLVALAAPAHYERHIRGAAEAAGLDTDGTEQLLDLLSAAMGADVRAVAIPQRAPTRHEPALFMHAEDDRVVPIDESLASARAWPGAEHRRLVGLGHKRLLGNAGVVAAAVDFLTRAA